MACHNRTRGFPMKAHNHVSRLCPPEPRLASGVLSHHPEQRTSGYTRGDRPHLLTKALALSEAFQSNPDDVANGINITNPMICMNPGCGYITKRDDATDRECHICHSQSMVTAKELQRKLNA
jgi:hypothetical protein